MSRYFIDNSYYFITVPTIDRYPFFDTSDKKNLVLNQINSVIKTYNSKDFNFSIISNHYHFIAYFYKSEIIPMILKQINGRSAYDLNSMSGNKKSVWDEYHLYLVENDVLLSKVLGYVVGNPLKHKEVKTLKELEKYPFSSYSSLIKRIGKRNVDEYIKSVIQINEERFIESNFKEEYANKFARK